VISNFIMICKEIDFAFYSVMKSFLKNMKFDFDKETVLCFKNWFYTLGDYFNLMIEKDLQS